MKKEYRTRINWDGVLTAIINLIWFGAWLYIIFGLHNSGLWILIPMLFHWKESEQEGEESEVNYE
jgi:hypothetical protein